MASLSPLRQFISSLLGVQHETGKPRAEKPAPRATGDETAPTLDSPIFAARLLEMFKRHDDLMLNGLFVLGLDDIKTHYGGAWPSKRDTVHEVIRQAIRNRLSHDDTFAIYGDSAYIIVFGRLTREAARIKCAMIAEEVSQRVFGCQAGPERVAFATASLKENGRVVMDTGEFEDALKQAAAHAIHDNAVEQIKAPGAKSRPPTPSRATPARKRAAGAPPPPPDPGARAAEDTTPAPQPGRGQGKVVMALPNAIRAMLPEREREKTDQGVFTFVFRPVWLVKRNTLASHVCIPARLSLKGVLDLGGPALQPRLTDAERASYDIACLHAVIAELRRAAEAGKVGVIIVPIHFSTLSRGTPRKAYLKVLTAQPDWIRRHLIFELIATPELTPERNIDAEMTVLNSLSKTVMYRARLETAGFAPHHAGRTYAVGLDLTNIALPEAELFKRMEAFLDSAAELKLKTYAHGLRSRSLVMFAVTAGFDYVDGDPVSNTQEVTSDVASFSAKGLYAPLS